MGNHEAISLPEHSWHQQFLNNIFFPQGRQSLLEASENERSVSQIPALAVTHDQLQEEK